MASDKQWRQQIRKAYSLWHPHLIQGIEISPYELGFDFRFSPIERNVWEVMRAMGVVFYPQYPVGPYFLDFGNPYRGIGIEVDSVRWHKDAKKDAIRQKKIEKAGWDIYRIGSKETYSQKEIESFLLQFC